VTLVAELTRALNELDRQPHGAARIATAERLVDEAAETGDRPVLIAALQEQITAYNFGGESQRMLVPFARVLKMWDDRPEDFNDYARYRLFWHFKWASTGMIWHPDVPLATVQHWLDEMERRYRIAGHGMHPVYADRHHLAVHLGDDEKAAHYFDEWTTAERTEMSDCHACELNAEGEWHEACGRDAEALRAWAPVLRGELTCLEEPHLVLAKSLLPLVRLGRLDDARANHLRGYRMVRGNANLLRAVGQHIEFAALTGNEARGLEMLAEHAGRLALGTADGASNRLGLHEGAAVLLRRLVDVGQGSLELPIPPGSSTTVAALLPQVEREVAAIGERFDRRNGTTSVSDRSRQRLAARPLLDSLPLGVRTSSFTVPVRRSTVDTEPAQTLDTLIADATRLADARDPRAARAWERVAAAVSESESDLPAPVVARIAESRAIESARSAPDEAVERFVDVAEMFAAAGDPARAAVNRARAGLAEAMSGQHVTHDPDAAVAELAALRASGHEFPERLRWAARFCATRARLTRWMAADEPETGTRVALDRELAEMIADAERGGARYELADALVNRAQVALVAGDVDAAPALLDRAIESYVQAGAFAPAAEAMLLRARIALGGDDPATAQTHLVRARQVGGDLLDAGSRADIAGMLAESHLRLGGEDGPAAAEALIAADLLDASDPEAANRARRQAAFAFERDGRPAEAAALLESILPDLEKQGAEDLAQARHQYGRCLRALGEHREAARVFIDAAGLVKDWPDQVPHASLTHDAGQALEQAGMAAEAGSAYLRAAELWRAVGDAAAAVRATRAAAWTHVQRSWVDWPAALALFEEAATLSDEERPETLFQTAQLLTDWPEETRPDGSARRVVALADEAAAGFRRDGDLDRATRADLLAADTLCGPLDDRDGGLARIARTREHAAAAGERRLVEWCDTAAEQWS